MWSSKGGVSQKSGPIAPQLCEWENKHTQVVTILALEYGFQCFFPILHQRWEGGVACLLLVKDSIHTGCLFWS